MKTYLKSATVIALTLAIICSPSISFAKENGKKENKGNSKNSPKIERVEARSTTSVTRGNDDDDRGEREQKNENNSNSCLRAYGHLIAPGWNKKNGQLNIDVSNCWLPFGIAKKFRGNNASTTPDVTAPTITNIAFTPAQMQAEVRWNTNENANSIVFWSTNSTVDTSDTAANKITKNDLTKNHRVILKNLTPDTTYYVVVKSKDAAGNSSQSDVNSFKTQAPSADTQPPVISNVVSVTGSTTIQVGWKTNENTTDRVYYSTILPVVLNASTTAFVSNSSATTTHLLTLASLTPNTTYYLVIESTDAAGNVTTSATFSTHTSGVVIPVDTTPPTISGITATVGASTTTIAWNTDEAATSKVFYSTVNPLDTSASTTASVLNGSLISAHSISITGLATSTAYFFKVQSVDAAGNTTTSDQFTATTTSGM